MGKYRKIWENIEKTTGKHGKIRGKYGISGSNVFGLDFLTFQTTQEGVSDAHFIEKH
jgi:hypothetical protein